MGRGCREGWSLRVRLVREATPHRLGPGAGVSSPESPGPRPVRPARLGLGCSGPALPGAGGPGAAFMKRLLHSRRAQLPEFLAREARPGTLHPREKSGDRVLAAHENGEDWMALGAGLRLWGSEEGRGGGLVAKPAMPGVGEGGLGQVRQEGPEGARRERVTPGPGSGSPSQAPLASQTPCAHQHTGRGDCL